MTTFINWLAQFEDEPTNIGDLARDMCADRREGCFNGETAEDLRRHIIDHHRVLSGAYKDALGAAEERYSEAAEVPLNGHDDTTAT